VNPSPCARVRPELKAFADGELSPLVRYRVARHLRVCPACQQELIQMQQLTEELRTDEAPSALEPELRARILASAPTDEAAQQREEARRRRIARKKTVLALGAASLVGGLLYVSAQNGDSTSSVQSNLKQMELGKVAAPSTDAASSPSAPEMSGDKRAVASSASAGAPANALSPSPMRSAADKGAVFADGHLKVREQDAQPFSETGDSLANRIRRAAPAGSSANDAETTIITHSPYHPQTASSIYVNGSAVLSDNSIVPQNRAVHREGSVAVAVDNAEDRSNDVQTLVKNAGGFVASNALETGAGGRRTATLDCRVPVADFEKLISKVGSLGRVTAKSVNGQDITAQIAGSAARRAALAQELAIAQARLNAKEKAAKKRDADQVFALRSDVREVRLQAAQARAQLETLRKYGDTSTLWVSLQDTAPPKAAGLSNGLGLGSSPVWSSFLANARIPFQLMLLVLAYLPIWLPALIIWRKFGRKWLTE